MKALIGLIFKVEKLREGIKKTLHFMNMSVETERDRDRDKERERDRDRDRERQRKTERQWERDW